MRATHRSETELVVAARAGDRLALDELVAVYLPLVYTLARRALGDRPDIDDLVQDVMLRALRRLPMLRDPDSFRLWLTSIAVRQVGTYLERSARAEERMTVLDEMDETADPGFEEAALLRAELSGQRRQAQRASRWLDPDDRVLLSLWWLEIADEMSRADLASVLGVSVAHAGVRVQRLRGRLETARGVVAALDLRPRCPELAEAMTGWDGEPSPLWRKRAGRHVRDCPVCSRAAEGLLPAERLFPVLALLPVPAGLAAAVLGKLTLGKAGVVAAGTTLAGASAGGAATAGAVSAGGAGTGILGVVAQAIGAHPIVAAVTAGTIAVGAAAGTAEVVSPATPPAPPVIAAPQTPSPASSDGRSPTGPARPAGTAPAAGTLAPGPVSLESANAPGTFVSTARSVGVLAPAGPDSPAGVRAQATFEAIEGLADVRCYTFRFSDGRYLRHASWRLQLSIRERTELFRGDATFCPRPGPGPGTVELESANYPGWFVRHRDGELWVDQSDGSDAFRADSSFVVRAPLAE